MEEKLLTGIDDIDNQHRELFARIGHLTRALYGGDSKKALVKLVMYLENYVTEHFKTEEELMFQCGYKQINDHKYEHRKFTKFFEDVKKDIDTHGADSYLAIRMEKEVQKWWIDHIENRDMQYVDCFQKYLSKVDKLK